MGRWGISAPVFSICSTLWAPFSDNHTKWCPSKINWVSWVFKTIWYCKCTNKNSYGSQMQNGLLRVYHKQIDKHINRKWRRIVLRSFPAILLIKKLREDNPNMKHALMVLLLCSLFSTIFFGQAWQPQFSRNLAGDWCKADDGSANAKVKELVKRSAVLNGICLLIVSYGLIVCFAIHPTGRT